MKKFNSSLLSKVSLNKAKITYDDFDIDPTLTFESQKFSFKEDILQLEIGDNYVIDVGYYPEFNPKGFFLVRVIKDIEWDSPVFKKKFRNVKFLPKYLQEAIDFISQAE